MKRFIYILTISLLITACEDVIDVDVRGEEPRLTIDALIRIDESISTFIPRIRAFESSSFFDEPTPAELTQATITNTELGRTLILIETPPGSGIYEENDPVPTSFFTSGELILQIEHKNKLYLARTEYAKTNNFNSIEQGDGNLFGDNETEIIVSFTDIPDEENYYLFDFDFNEFLVTEDTFYPGQDFSFSYFYDDQLDAGRELSISILGIDESFYTYMDQLIVQSGDDFGPFTTPAATVRGNLINVTDIDNIDSFDNVGDPNNFALGYFAVCQTYTQNFTVEE